MQSAFGWLVDNYPRLADWNACARRIASLMMSLDGLERAERGDGIGRIQRGETKGEAMQTDRKRKAKASNQDWESATDPDSRVMMHSDGHTHLSYKIDTTVDLETGVIASIGADYANVSDQTDCLQRVDEATDKLAEHGKEVEIVVGDKGHHSGANLAGLEERGLIALISSPNTGKKNPGFERSDFTYDETKDQFTCPAGHILSKRARKDTESRVYQAKGSACRKCPHFGVCTESKTGRSLSIPAHDDLIQANRARVHSDEARPGAGE